MRKRLVAMVIFSSFLFCSCQKRAVRHTVQYFISGKSVMNVSYTDVSGETISVNSVSSAWAYAFNAPEDGRLVQLHVTSHDGSAVGGSILIDGQQAAVNSSNTGSLTLMTQFP